MGVIEIVAICNLVIAGGNFIIALIGLLYKIRKKVEKKKPPLPIG